MVEIEIDGKQLEVAEGSTIIEAADSVGIYIPRFCYHKKLTVAANCRQCLVEVAKAPKPLPACATPVAKGMKVMTHSKLATDAQKGVMEFLLINHPLDCPICDQGGECPLQDLAVGYGASESRFGEPKRSVANKNFGPLIASEMTRCILCTRCVRFGEEIGGIMEFGLINRGEREEIVTFVGKTVDSELSGNVIDLCPVGALTSKPFRFSARNWELTRRPSISPHTGLGANLIVQVKQNRVMRVLPRDNEAINECWLSDKDRFAYEGLNSEERLARPMLKQDGVWREVPWQIALQFAADGLKRIRDQHGAAQIGALATPHQTFEELYLLQKLMRGLGSGNVDFRLRQTDFSADALAAGVPWLGMKIADFNTLDRVLVIGSTLRKDHPLLAHRIRQATKRGTELSLINPVDDELLMRVAHKAIVAPSQMAMTLAAVVKAAAQQTGRELPAAIRDAVAAIEPSADAQAIAASLLSGKSVAVLLGNLAQHHQAAAQLQGLAQALADLTGARFGFLGEAANSVGGYLAGAVPNAAEPRGLHAADMLAQRRKAYLLLGMEAELDSANPAAALAALQAAELVIVLSPYQHRAADYADVMLPIAPFTETAGTFVNTEGTVQSFNGVVQPLAETRPAWKVLRVLGNLLGIAGFEYDSSADIRQEALADVDIASRLDNRLAGGTPAAFAAPAADGVERIGEVPIYAADAIVRRAPALQKTRDAQAPVASMNHALAGRLGLRDGDSVRVVQGDGAAQLPFAIDDRLPENCVRVACAHPLTVELGDALGTVMLERVAAKERAVG
jgi:NADH-quinone oxidoreductase subunit G